MFLSNTEAPTQIYYSIPTIDHVRKSMKFTQADMAAFLQVSRLTFIKWEKKPETMPIGKYAKLADEYNRFIKLTNTTEEG